MQVLTTIKALRKWRAKHFGTDETVALVPTMGNLHAGHLQLARRALTLTPAVIASIFVNPLQFGPNEDLAAYPRTPEADLAQLEALGVAAVFMPSVAEVYPPAESFGTRVLGGALTRELCGAARPGHFDGVLTVVSKLFNLVQPDVAVFGKKDYQQLALIQQMVQDLNIPVELVGVETERADDGLALSSRNGYLTPQERQTAPLLAQTLQNVAADVLSSGSSDTDLPTRCAHATETAVGRLIDAGFQPDYLSVRAADTLAPVSADTRNMVALVAARLGRTRLIDNLEFTLPG